MSINVFQLGSWITLHVFVMILTRRYCILGSIGGISDTGLGMGTTLLTDTVDSGVVQVISEGAFAAERAIRVDADAVLADAGVVQTLVHIYTHTQGRAEGTRWLLFQMYGDTVSGHEKSRN